MKVTLTEKQRKIIIGALLGDGFLLKEGKKVKFGFKQRKEYKEYVEWVFKELQNICTESGVMYRSDYNQYYFRTSVRKHDFVNLYQKFYRFSPERNKHTKVVPEEIKDLLKNPISVAVWYMDDGSLDFRPKSHYAYFLATHNFSLEEARKLTEVLKDNFKVDSTVYNNLIRGKRYPRIYIGVQGRERFREIVGSYVSRFKCFSHKLPLK